MCRPWSPSHGNTSPLVTQRGFVASEPSARRPVVRGGRCRSTKSTTLGSSRKCRRRPKSERSFALGFASPPTSVDGKGKHALVVLKEDGGCHFLSEDRLCSLQKRYGGDVLSDTCATYPRQVKLVGERIELTAKVSCPEVARLLLLVPDACEVVEIGPDLLERRILHDTLEPATAEPYAAGFDEVRLAMMRLLTQPRFPLASRLAFLGCLADALSPILYRGVQHRDPPARARALSSFQSSAVLAQLHQEFSQIAVPDATAASLVMRVLGSRMGSRGSLGELVTRIFADPEAPSPSIGCGRRGQARTAASGRAARLLPAEQEGMGAQVRAYYRGLLHQLCSELPDPRVVYQLEEPRGLCAEFVSEGGGAEVLALHPPRRCSVRP